MKYLLTLLVFMPLFAQATELKILNSTGDIMRILWLQDKCGKNHVLRGEPVYISKDEAFVIQNVTPVIHTYEMCGSGFCTQSAIGFNKTDKSMTMDVVLDDAGIISGKATPDVWPGNMECPK